MKIRFIIALFISILFLGCSESPYQSLITSTKINDPILFQNANIFNGTDSVLIQNMDVLIQDGIIQSINKEIATSHIPNINIIEASGKTLMPGLIDAHVHLSGSGAVPWEKVSVDIEYNLSAYLYAGITTVYDLGGLANEISKISNKVEANEILGPTVYNTHIPITVKDGHPIPLTKEMLPAPLRMAVNLLSPTIDQPEEAPNLIKKYLSNDIDYVKIICDQIPSGTPEMSFDILNTLIDEVHSQDKKTIVHIGSPQNALDAISAGADVLAHGVWRGRLNDEQANIIASSEIPIIYTAAAFLNVESIYNGNYGPNELDKKLVPQSILDPVSGSNGKDVTGQPAMSRFFEDVDNESDNWSHNFKILYEKGAEILVGTDSNLPGTYAGSTYFQEMSTLKMYGMSNYDILKGATYLNASAFINNPNFGSISEGKRANLLLVNGNPLLDLEIIKNPEQIILKGMIIERIK